MTRRVSLGRSRRPRPDGTLPPRLGEALRMLAEQNRVNAAAGSAHQATYDARSLGQRLMESTGVAIGESRRALGRPLFRDEPVRMAVNRAVVTLQTRPHPTFERDLASAFSPARLASVPPQLAEPLDTLGTLLEQLRAARQNRAWDTGRRLAWVDELATAMDALVVALKTLPDVQRPPGDPASTATTAPSAPGPDEHAQEPSAGRYGATPAPVPPRNGYDSTETGPYTPAPAAPAAYTPTAQEPDRQTPTTTPLFRYRGEE